MSAQQGKVYQTRGATKPCTSCGRPTPYPGWGRPGRCDGCYRDAGVLAFGELRRPDRSRRMHELGETVGECERCEEPLVWNGHLRRFCDRCKSTARPGFVVWEGRSAFNREPIRVFLSRPGAKRANRKIGGTQVVTIMPAQVFPLEARATGADRSVCGACPLRPSQGGGCYVHMLPGPEATAYGHRMTPYPLLETRDLAMYRDQVVRLAEWGDPAAVPLEVWAPLRAEARAVLGYTHAWRDLDPALWGWCMASVETAADAILAQRAGWRTFRVMASDEVLVEGERRCPASLEAKSTRDKVTCETCRLCDGWSRERPSLPNIALQAHGSTARLVHRKRRPAQEIPHGR